MSKKLQISNGNKEEVDSFGEVPLEITIDILSRLPIRSIIECKGVCKAWHNVIERREFTDEFSRRSRGDRHLVVFPYRYLWRSSNLTKPKKMLELEDAPNSNNNMVVLNLGPFSSNDYLRPLVRSSVDGLILLQHQHQHLLICNPITCEYVRLPPPPLPLGYKNYVFGFGVSRISKQYKVVGLIQSQCQCQVYTLGVGGGEWRTTPVGPPSTIWSWSPRNDGCAFVAVGGNLHWIVATLEKEEVCCFDLESEVLTSFSTPPRQIPRSYGRLYVLEDSLCLCDHSSSVYGDETALWLMRRGEGEGEGTYWTKDFVISLGSIFPIKVLGDGDILLAANRVEDLLFYYSKKTKTVQSYTKLDLYIDAPVIYTPSFLPLKALLKDMKGEEDVQFF